MQVYDFPTPRIGISFALLCTTTHESWVSILCIYVDIRYTPPSRSVHAAQYICIPGDAPETLLSSHISRYEILIPQLFELVDKTILNNIYSDSAQQCLYVCTRTQVHTIYMYALSLCSSRCNFSTSAGNDRRDYTYIHTSIAPLSSSPPFLSHHPFIPPYTIYYILPYPTVRFAAAIRNGNLSNVSHNWAIIAPVIIKHEARFRRVSRASASPIAQEIEIAHREIEFTRRTLAERILRSSRSACAIMPLFPYRHGSFYGT